jgi:hypothetical protein
MNEEAIKRVEDLEKRVAKLEQLVRSSGSSVPPAVSRRSQMSVVEFLKEKKPSSAVSKALVFAVYHENHSGRDVFNTEDILSLWRQAKETPPTNINDLINKNIKKGFIAEEKGQKRQKKSWFVTTSGTEAVSKGFQK